MKIGSIDILKAYLGALELTNSNAFIGTIPVIENGPEPLDKDYFYLQPSVAGDYSVSTNDEVWKQNDTFEFSLNKTNWRKFSSLTHSTDSVGFDVYMTNNPNLVALALDINAYNEKVVGQNYIVGISEMGPTTAATFLGTDENFAYYVGTLENTGMMDFQWCFMEPGMSFPLEQSNNSTDRMFEWDGTDYSGTNTNISDYSSFNVTSITITETIPLSVNDKLYLRNTSGSIHSGIISSIQSVNYNIGGIFNTLTDYTDDTYTITSNYANRFFMSDTNLISAGDLKLPATTLANSCYSGMFQRCTSLTTAPTLPATTLANDCYSYMFQGCTNLTTAPELPATTLASNCYYYMFQGCTSLTTAPELLATTLADYCYAYMFWMCSKLSTAPSILPATTLAPSCYRFMFNGCTSLTNAPELPATTLTDYCYANMFANCKSLTTAPALPATTLKDSCYSSMFNGCTKLNYIKCLATNISASGCTTNWVNGVASSGKFVKAASMTGWNRNANGIPSGWSVQNAA